MNKPSLLTRYETLRRKEFETLTGLVDALGKVDGLPAEQMDQARDALFHADHPYLIVLMGAFNTGKSSIINALIGEPVLGVGPTPTTDRIVILRQGPSVQRIASGDTDTIFHPSPLLERVSLVDTPGLDSVFKGHDETTNKFLHRADIVLLVMLATQAMSQSNVEYLQSLRAYGKRIIIVVNQIDVLDSDERATLKDFVAQQAKTQLSSTPEVWMVSAKLALEANQKHPRDAALWDASGFAQIESFITSALGDAARVRQKLETPLQIVRNVSSVALAQVREKQNALTGYRKSAQNVRAQMEQAGREQGNTVTQTMAEIDSAFAETITRGQAAIRDMFQLSRAFGLVAGGLLELTGLARFSRRFGVRTPAKVAFEARHVNEPLDQLPRVIDSLGPRLEGRDVKDVDDLIAYTRREIEALPGSLQGKMVGKLQPPLSYDRSILPAARPELISILDKAKSIEFARIDKAVQNTVIVLAFYEIAVIVVALVFGIAFGGSTNGGAWILLVLAVIALLLIGLGFVPVRGLLMSNAYAARLDVIKEEFLVAFRRATDQQIAFGARMRQDAVTPFLRLVESQTSQVDAVKSELERYGQTLTGLEKELAALKD